MKYSMLIKMEYYVAIKVNELVIHAMVWHG